MSPGFLQPCDKGGLSGASACGDVGMQGPSGSRVLVPMTAFLFLSCSEALGELLAVQAGNLEEQPKPPTASPKTSCQPLASPSFPCQALQLLGKRAQLLCGLSSSPATKLGTITEGGRESTHKCLGPQLGLGTGDPCALVTPPFLERTRSTRVLSRVERHIIMIII